MHKTLGELYAKELEAESASTRKCLERVPESLFDYKPHEKSMLMRHLLLVVADIPSWIAFSIKEGDIDLATFRKADPKTTGEMVTLFDENMKEALAALRTISDEQMQGPFRLLMSGQELFTSTKEENISSSINHLVHHRGQLTVYMRLNDIAVPSVYGPTADDKNF